MGADRIPALHRRLLLHGVLRTVSFHVRLDSEINRITQKRAHLLAVVEKANALSEMEDWLPYRIYLIGSTTVWGILAIAAGVATFRAIVHSRGVGGLHVKLLAVGIALPAIFMFILGIAPPVLIQNGWEKYTWLSW